MGPASPGARLSRAPRGADACEPVPRRSSWTPRTPCPRPGLGSLLPRAHGFFPCPPLCCGAHTLMRLTEKGQRPRNLVLGDVFVRPSRSVFGAGNPSARMVNALTGFHLRGHFQMSASRRGACGHFVLPRGDVGASPLSPAKAPFVPPAGGPALGQFAVPSRTSQPS